MTAFIIFLSAFLLFLVEPLISKWILPWYGGVSSVWTTCLLFFQSVLLVGYGWAYLLSKLRSARAQLLLHLLLAAAALFFLPIIPSAAIRPDGSEEPITHLLYVLSLCIGAPFLVLSATAPLLQSWRYRFAGEQSPYWLYAVSNTGSFLGLLAYPFVLEPLLDLPRQSVWWSWGFAVFGMLLLVQALSYAVKAPQKPPRLQAAPPTTPTPRLNPRIVLEWFLLSACASWLLLATTNHLCRDVASIPLLWVIPLALFLLSYVLTFARRSYYHRRACVVLFFIALMLLALLHVQGAALLVTIATALCALFFGCMLCNGEMVACKPAAAQLSFFYFISALGGAAGALFVSVIAPLLFSDYLEYALGFQLCALLVLLRLLEADKVFERGGARAAVAWCFLAALALGGGVLSMHMGNDSGDLVSRRSFFGVTRVRDVYAEGKPTRRELYHGTILHGIQFAADPMRPGAYFGPTSGVGRTLRACERPQGRNIAVIGLGIGTLAAYGRAGDHFTFWDINPDIIEVARTHFTFLAQSSAEVQVLYGDGRLGLERQQAIVPYDLIIMDAFNGDSIPVHLVTKEAISLYLSRLAPGGALVFNISNLYLDLKPVLARVAAEFGLTGRYVPSHGDAAQGTIENEYVILSRDAALFDHPALAGAARALAAPPDFRLWTDSYASLWRIVR